MSHSIRKSRTISVSILAPASAVYEFAHDPRNLPIWAPGFCQAIERRNDAWVIDSPLGDATIRFAERNAWGVLDHRVTLSSGEQFDNPMRVVSNGDGSEVLFTLFQAAGMDDAALAADASIVENDLLALKRAVEGRTGESAAPAGGASTSGSGSSRPTRG